MGKFALSVCFVFSAVLGALAAVKPANDVNDPTAAPSIVSDCDVDAGDTLSGYAWDCDAPVDVIAKWDDTGKHVNGSPVMGSSSSTDFDFVTTSNDNGRTFTITAFDGVGNDFSKQITVNN